MPELPEVETTRRGIAPHVLGKRLDGALVRNAALRWPVPDDLNERLAGQPVDNVGRRGKYLILTMPRGHLIIHLGMSGSLRICAADTPLKKHDHIDIRLPQQRVMRYHDPRRFGSMHWTPDPVESHPLLAELGVEPLSDDFDGAHLYSLSRGRKIAVKDFIMNTRTVVGVGNIYAAESLFLTGIHPFREAGRISATRYQALAENIKIVLAASIEQGGTTLRDFVTPDSQPGYFAQTLRVYGRTNEPCRACATPIKMARKGQRSTFYCPKCQR